MLVISGKINKVPKILELSQKYDKVLLVTKSKDISSLKGIIEIIKFNSTDVMWGKIDFDSYYRDFFKGFDLVVFHMFSSEVELNSYKKLENDIGINIAVMIQSSNYCDVYEA